MKSLKSRSSADGEAFHAASPVRVYATDPVQEKRIEKARAMVQKCIAQEPSTIVEVGCGTADISGPFSGRNKVTGIDCNGNSLAKAKMRFPEMSVRQKPINGESFPCDVVILCEVLEHLEDPHKVAQAWLSQAVQSVISHPLNESIMSTLSDGEHQWSLSEDDFRGWFAAGGHELLEMEIFEMGQYQIIMGRGKRKA